jgi:hypothetical protein
MERSSQGFGRISQVAGSAELPRLLAKTMRGFAGGNPEMRARPEIRERILCAKLRRWARIGSSPYLYPNCSVSNARRNYAKLYARHGDLARRLKLSVASAYPPI